MAFFDKPEPDSGGPRTAPPANTPRTIAASAQKIKLSKGKDRIDKRKPSTWQTAAWGFFDEIGEVHYAFSLVGQVLSRIRLYAAVMDDPETPPIRAMQFLDELEEKDVKAKETRRVLEAADELVRSLLLKSPGMGSGLMRELGINISVAGEAYLVRHEGRWMIASSDELQQRGDNLVLKLDRTATRAEETILPKDAFVARIWRSHPRFSNEPDSSMLGVLDQAEKLVLLDASVRAMTRSRMNAGIIFIPEGLMQTSATDEDSDEDSTVETALIEALTSPLQDESVATTVVPLLLTGPAELGKEMKKIDLGRIIDEQMVELGDRTLDRVLQGLDIPKDIVKGLAEVRYSNAIVIDDSMYRAHIEPLALMIVDALTQAYLQPALRKELGKIAGAKADIVDRVVIWFDPSAIVTRPDRSQAANEGYDRRILSSRAWRAARGFNEHDAPGKEEKLMRIVDERAQLPPEMGAALLETMDPEFFAEARVAGQEQSGMTEDISNLLDGAVEDTDAEEIPGPKAAGSDELTPGGAMPPRE